MPDVNTPNKTNAAPTRPANSSAPASAAKPATVSTSTQKTSKPKKKSGLKVLIIAVCIIAVLLILAIGTILYTVNNTTSAPVNVSKQLVSDIQTKNASGAYALLSPAAQATISSSDFEKIVNQIGPILNGVPKMQSKEVSAETGDNQTAKVVYQIQGSDGLTYNMTITLVKNNGNWQVQNFDSKQQQ